jgi:hypothetical protein
MLEGAALPLNQGRSGTCVGHSFAQALCAGIQEKYGVPCDPNLVVEKVKVLCPCWDGHRTEHMPREWNDTHAMSGAAIEDVDKARRYNVRVDCRKIETFEQARAEMEKARRQVANECLPPWIKKFDLATTDEQAKEWGGAAEARRVGVASSPYAAAAATPPALRPSAHPSRSVHFRPLGRFVSQRPLDEGGAAITPLPPAFPL